MTIQEKDYSLISKKLLSKADKDGIERKIVKVVVRKGDAILMLKRAETERFSGLYELPGGDLKRMKMFFFEPAENCMKKPA